MPFVNVKVAGELSTRQKSEIAEKFSEILEKVVGKPKQYTYIVFEDVPYEDWAIGGKLLSE